jgi:3-oxoacyl-[acyl-carrier protein] reductase
MDLVSRFATHPLTHELAKRLSLPLALPTPLRRHGVDDQTPLAGLRIFGPGALSAFGAQLVSEGELDGVVLDVTGEAAVRGLRATLQPLLARLRKNGRVVLVTTHAHAPEDAAWTAAVTGFAKSLARELGRKGTTCNVIEKLEGTSVDGTLVFLLSPRARYITSQRILLTRTGPAPSFSLAGKHAVVTGGARGIGAAVAATLARQGARVTLADLPMLAADGDALAGTLPGARFVATDVTDEKAVSELFAEPADILVNNAGITRDRTFAKLGADGWDKVIAVNFDAAVRCTDAFLRTKKSGGEIVFLSSVVGISGNFGQTAYTLSKAAVMGYVSALAHARKDIRVNAVAPGFIDTSMTRKMPVFSRVMSTQLTSLLQAGEAEDVAEVIAFLASDASAGIAGQTLRVDGGMFLGA